MDSSYILRINITMRYGLPEVETLPQAVVPLPSQRQRTTSQLLLLAKSLRSLDSLHISNALAIADSRRRRLELFCEQAKAHSQAEISALDLESQHEARKLTSDIQRIKAHQEELRQQELLRQKRLQEEKQRAEKKAREEQQRIEAEALKKAEEEKRQKAELERKKAEEEKKRAEEEKKKAEEKKKGDDAKKAALAEKIKQEKAAAGRKSKGFTQQLEIEAALIKYFQDIADIKRDVVQPVNNNKDLKKQVGVVKRKINIKLGQLSNSMAQLNTICNEVVELAQYTKGDPLAFKWILNFIAKAIVSQAEAEVTVKPTAALPLGRLAMHLLKHLDGLYYFMCARFVKKCCFTIGYTGTIDTEEGRIRMGWKRVDDKWESEVKYEERVGGILTVWAVMSRLESTSAFEFFSMEAEWRFLARVLNTDSQLITNAHYVVVCNWWEAAAEQVVHRFGKQAFKVLYLAYKDWAKQGAGRSFPAATRLEVLGDDLLQNKNFNSLKEMES